MINPVKNQRIIISTIVIFFAVMPSDGTTANLKALDPGKPLSAPGVIEKGKTFAIEKTELEAPEVEKIVGAKTPESVMPTQNIVLEGIFYSGHNEQTATAVINGQALKVNDYIGEYRLVSVKDNSVVLRSSEELLKLSLFSSIVKK
jgi:hypothetical protein|tara:strand:+ start:332 stop:769 length:438 start_codon:yes stop_codon:yes gene_type:complete